jgi:hypothetical protein
MPVEKDGGRMERGAREKFEAGATFVLGRRARIFAAGRVPAQASQAVKNLGALDAKRD